MEKYSEMSNTELKIHLETLHQEFESKKNNLIQICEEMSSIEKKYINVKNELEIRKNLFI
jgi:hypothetical protein